MLSATAAEATYNLNRLALSQSGCSELQRSSVPFFFGGRGRPSETLGDGTEEAMEACHGRHLQLDPKRAHVPGSQRGRRPTQSSAFFWHSKG